MSLQVHQIPNRTAPSFKGRNVIFVQNDGGDAVKGCIPKASLLLWHIMKCNNTKSIPYVVPPRLHDSLENFDLQGL
jgi:hypothetical protein